MNIQVTKDCLRHTKVLYYLDVPILDDLACFFPESKLSVNRFSKLVENAKDHFTLTKPFLFHLSGVFSERLLCSTFYKHDMQRNDLCRSEVESVLLGFEQRYL